MASGNHEARESTHTRIARDDRARVEDISNGFSRVERKERDTYVVSFPESEAWACDGVWMVRDRLADLYAQIGAVLRG